MAPKRPLSRKAIENLCPCPAWELALFCECCTVLYNWLFPYYSNYSTDGEFKTDRSPMFIGIKTSKLLKKCFFRYFYSVAYIVTFCGLSQSFESCVEQVPMPSVRRGWLCLSLSALAGWLRGTICPCCTSASWELALFCDCCMIEFFSFILGNNLPLLV